MYSCASVKRSELGFAGRIKSFSIGRFSFGGSMNSLIEAELRQIKSCLNISFSLFTRSQKSPSTVCCRSDNELLRPAADFVAHAAKDGHPLRIASDARRRRIFKVLMDQLDLTRKHRA